MDIKSLVKESVVIFDGGMGTMLQRAGLAAGEAPELWSLTRPRQITDIHKAYLEAGADIVTANTFGASPRKLARTGVETEDVIAAGVACAKASGAKYTALDIGPSGQLMEPLGTLSFSEAYGDFARQAICGEKHGADLAIIETVSDLYEAKAAVLAVLENTSLPVICTLTFQNDGRTFVGCDPVSAAVTLSGLGVSAVGVNCSLGAKELLPVVRQFLRYSSVPIIAQPNAGLPEYIDGETRYNVGPEEFAAYCAEMARMGVRILGGCCGTTPDFIRELKKQTASIPYKEPERGELTAVSSGSKTVFFGKGVTVIGGISPAGNIELEEAVRAEDYDYILDEAVSQTEAGCDIIGVDVELPGVDEPEVMSAAIKHIQGFASVPVMIDSQNAEAVEAGARAYNGRPVICPINGKPEVMEKIFPIAKKYGAVIVGLTLDGGGIPPTAEGRLEIAEKMVSVAEAYGIEKRDILIDCLAPGDSGQREQEAEALRAIRLVKEKLGVKTVLSINGADFFAAALGAGLDAAIINPISSEYVEIADSFRGLFQVD